MNQISWNNFFKCAQAFKKISNAPLFLQINSEKDSLIIPFFGPIVPFLQRRGNESVKQVNFCDLTRHFDVGIGTVLKKVFLVASGIFCFATRFLMKYGFVRKQAFVIVAALFALKAVGALIAFFRKKRTEVRSTVFFHLALASAFFFMRKLTRYTKMPLVFLAISLVAKGIFWVQPNRYQRPVAVAEEEEGAEERPVMAQERVQEGQNLREREQDVLQNQEYRFLPDRAPEEIVREDRPVVIPQKKASEKKEGGGSSNR